MHGPSWSQEFVLTCFKHWVLFLKARGQSLFVSFCSTWPAAASGQLWFEPPVPEPDGPSPWTHANTRPEVP